MTETRQRGTDKGDVVTEALIDGVWVVVVTDGPGPQPIADEAPEADKPRRGRPRKA
jgi:hypothetical protein